MERHESVGKAVVDVIIRDPVVVTATLPRFLLTGDRAPSSMDLDNVEGQAGDYAVTIKRRVPRRRGNPNDDHAAPKAAQAVSFRLEVRPPGRQNLDRHRCGPNGLDARTRLRARRAAGQRSCWPAGRCATLAKGESLTLSPDMFSDLVAGHRQRRRCRSSLSTALDAASILKALDRYPFGCSEQITSRAHAAALRQRSRARRSPSRDGHRDRPAHPRLRSNGCSGAPGKSNGSFGLWSAGGDDTWLDAYVTDFLTRAREKWLRGPGCWRSGSRSTACATTRWSMPTSRRRMAAVS
jgi:uncharacterized protein YfaS (alpha-2-macroglobulin family)